MSNFLHNNNYRENNLLKLFNIIEKNVSTELKRKLITNEKNQIKKFIKKIDIKLLDSNLINNTIKIMAKTLIDEFKSYDCTNLNNIYDDSQQIIRNTIGISSESSTSHGIYDSSTYLSKLHEENKKRLNDENNINIHSFNNIEAYKESLKNRQNSSNDSSNSSSNSSSNDSSNGFTLDNFLSNPKKLTRILNPQSLYKKAYFILDSRYRSSAGTNNLSNSITKYKWDFNLNSQPSDNNSSVNVIGNMRDIVSLRIYPFRIPYNSLLDNKYKRLSILIEELESQAFVAHEQRKFHFMLETDIDSSFINLNTNKYNDGYFYFEKPITSIETISITFANPLEKIDFNLDRCNYKVDHFSLNPLTKITTYNSNNADIFKHDLESGDRVYLTGFKTKELNSILSEQISIDKNITEKINSINGYNISVLDDYSFSIDLDTSNTQNPLNSIFNNVYFGSKRIFIPFEVEYIQPQIE